MPSTTTLLSVLGAATAAIAAWNSEGCYNTAGSLQSQGTYIYQSIGYCADTCTDGTTIALTGADECFCGQEIPPKSAKVEDSRCNTPCYGYPADICGGDGVYSVYTIDNSNHGWYGNASASSSPGTTTGSNSTSSGSSPASSAGISPSSTDPAQYTGAASQQVAALGAVVAFGALAAML